MKTLDPSAGLKLVLMNPFMHLAMILGFIFVMAYPQSKEMEDLQISTGFMRLAYQFWYAHIGCFILSLIASLWASKFHYEMIERLLEFVCVIGYIYVYVDGVWQIQTSKKRCASDPTMAHSCSNYKLVYHKWAQLELWQSHLFILGSVIFCIGYWAYTTCFRSNKKDVHDIRKQRIDYLTYMRPALAWTSMATVAVLLPGVACIISYDVWPTVTPATKQIDKESTNLVYCVVTSAVIHLISLLIKPGFFDLTPLAG